jgi:RNA polymerase sigma-70 factor (ECF subfamily)
LALAKRYVGGNDFEDISQNSFILIFQNIKNYKGSTDQLKSWISRIVVNESLQHLRKTKKLTTQEIDIGIILKNDEIALMKLTVEDLKKVIDKIEINHKIVFLMYVIEGYSHKEIGEFLNIKASSCRSRFTRAKQMIRDELQLIKNYENERRIRL